MIIDFNGGGSGGGSCKLEHKDYSIITNGVTPIAPSEGFDGIFEGNITVDVQPLLQEKTVEITGNGTTTIVPEQGYYGISKVVANTNVSSTGSALDITGTGWETEPYFPVDLSRTASLNDDIEYTRQKFSEWEKYGPDGQFCYHNDQIVYAPYIDTQNLTKLEGYGFFQGATKLFSFGVLDFKSVANKSAYWCVSDCPKLKYFEGVKNSNNIETLVGFLYNCKSLEEIPYFDMSSIKSLTQTFRGCSSIKYLPPFNTSSVVDFSSFCKDCTSLETVMPLKAENVKTTQSYNQYPPFQNCTALKDFGGFIGLKVSLDFSTVINLTKQSLLNIIAGLATVSNSPTLTLGSTNLAKLTEEEIAVGTAKGWQIVA